MTSADSFQGRCSQAFPNDDTEHVIGGQRLLLEDGERVDRATSGCIQSDQVQFGDGMEEYVPETKRTESGKVAIGDF